MSPPLERQHSSETYETKGPRCFVLGVCESCGRDAHRAAEHADDCPQRRQKWYLRKLVPVILTPFPAQDYIAVPREVTSSEHRAAELNVLDAARRLCALIGGDVDRWSLHGRRVTDEAGLALISLSAYLNDVAYFESEDDTDA